MVMNLGYIELGGSEVFARVYYDTTFTPVGDNQPLINGPRGWCLDLVNRTGTKTTVTITQANGTVRVLDVGPGDPVTAGAGRSLTKAQMASFGYTTRGNVGTIEIN